DHRILGPGVIQKDWLRRLLKQIDDRGTPLAERAGRDPRFQQMATVGPLERRDRQMNLETVRRDAGERRTQIGDFKEEKLLRKCKVLLYDSVARKRAVRIGKRRLVRLEPDEADRGGR